MLKKIILGTLIVILIFVIYIGALWFKSLDSLVDKDGMVYEEYNENIVSNL